MENNFCDDDFSSSSQSSIKSLKAVKTCFVVPVSLTNVSIEHTRCVGLRDRRKFRDFVASCDRYQNQYLQLKLVGYRFCVPRWGQYYLKNNYWELFPLNHHNDDLLFSNSVLSRKKQSVITKYFQCISRNEF